MAIVHIEAACPDPDLWVAEALLSFHRRMQPPWWRLFARLRWARKLSDLENGVRNMRAAGIDHDDIGTDIDEER
jgi:hypothetical protein